MGLLGACGVDSIDLRNCSEKTRQCGEAIHHRLIISLNQECDSAKESDHALEALALHIEDPHVVAPLTGMRHDN